MTLVLLRKFAENGDWLRGAKRCCARRNVAATVPVPFFRSGGPSKKGTGTVAGSRFLKQRVIEATEPVPIFDWPSCAVELGAHENRAACEAKTQQP